MIPGPHAGATICYKLWWNPDLVASLPERELPGLLPSLIQYAQRLFSSQSAPAQAARGTTATSASGHILLHLFFTLFGQGRFCNGITTGGMWEESCIAWPMHATPSSPYFIHPGGKEPVPVTSNRQVLQGEVFAVDQEFAMLIYTLTTNHLCYFPTEDLPSSITSKSSVDYFN